MTTNGKSENTKLTMPVSESRDHIQGSANTPVTSIVSLVHLTRKVCLAGDKQDGDFINQNKRAGRICSPKEMDLHE